MRSLSKMSGEEPTIVMVPPKIAQNPIGMSNRPRGISVRAEMRATTGRNKAAAPTFCMNDEINPTVPEMIGTMRCSVDPPTRKIQAATLLIRPVLSKPAPMIITAIMEITAFEANPSKIWFTSAKPPNPGT